MKTKPKKAYASITKGKIDYIIVGNVKPSLRLGLKPIKISKKK